MGISSLAKRTVLADVSNYTQGRKGYKICKITPHHMAGVLTAQRCGELFQNPSRDASANYGIGNDGEIACYVDENNRAWTSSSSSNDCQAITIEVSNSSAGGNWPISDAAWNSLVNLCVDICKRHNFRLNYDGTKNGSLTTHDMFANTNCPGPYLKGKLNELASIVNSRLDGNTSNNNTTSSKKSNEEIANEVIAGKWGNGDARKTALQNAGYDYSTIQAIVNQKLTGKTSNTTSNTKSINTIVDEVIAGKWGNGTDRKNRLTAAGYDYSEIQTAVNNKLSGKSTSSNKKSNETIANEVIAGKWGNGTDRKNRLTAAGYDYNAIQKIVNSKLK